MKQQQRKQMDYVTGLLTGNFEEEKSNGGTKKVFVPRFANPYPTLIQLINSTQRLRHDVLDREGIVAPITTIDRDIFKKDARDQHLLKIAKSKYNKEKNTDKFLKEKSELIKTFVDRIPNWGIGSKVTFI